ncbi:MAG: HD domain-containing protein [Acidimicrobiia bacterium]
MTPGSDGTEVAPAAAVPCPVEPDRHPDFVRLGDRFERAVDYAVEAHREQARKSSPVPYLAHLFGVLSLVLEYGGGEDQAIAGLLHDTLEDCGAEHAPAIEANFGAGVLDLVRACTDWEGPAGGAGKPPWRPRKEAYLAHLDELGPGHPALLVSCSDKLHNARAIRADLRREGLSVWDRFSQPAPDQRWYYRSLVDSFTWLLPGPLTDELRRTVRNIVRIDKTLRQ